jgi:RNase adaptor protein for sRNA GlmZ degradation
VFGCTGGMHRSPALVEEIQADQKRNIGLTLFTDIS